jgi:hypothetical protein
VRISSIQFTWRSNIASTNTCAIWNPGPTMNVLEPPVLVFNRYLIEIQKRAPRNASNRHPSFLKLTRVCFVSAYLDMINQLCSPSRTSCLSTRFDEGYFLLIMNPSFSLGNRLYRVLGYTFQNPSPNSSRSLDLVNRGTQLSGLAEITILFFSFSTVGRIYDFERAFIQLEVRDFGGDSVCFQYILPS